MSGGIQLLALDITKFQYIVIVDLIIIKLQYNPTYRMYICVYIFDTILIVLVLHSNI